MAREIGDVSAGGTIEAAWGNNVRNRAIMRYASSTARDSAVPSPGEGEVCYLEDTNDLVVYNGSAWETFVLAGDVYSETEVDTFFDDRSEGVLAYRSSTLGIGNATLTELVCNTQSYDDWGGWASTPNPGRITDDTAGYYIARMQVTFASNATGYRQCSIQRSGTQVAISRQAAIDGDTTPMNLVWVGSLDGTDYVSFHVYQTSGGSLNLNSGGTGQAISLHKLSIPS